MGEFELMQTQKFAVNQYLIETVLAKVANRIRKYC